MNSESDRSRDIQPPKLTATTRKSFAASSKSANSRQNNDRRSKRYCPSIATRSICNCPCPSDRDYHGLPKQHRCLNIWMPECPSIQMHCQYKSSLSDTRVTEENSLPSCGQLPRTTTSLTSSLSLYALAKRQKRINLTRTRTVWTLVIMVLHKNTQI